MKAMICLFAFNFLLLVTIAAYLKHQAKKEIKEWERKYNEFKSQVQKNNEAKESMETGNGSADFNASIDVLSKLKK